MKTYYKGVIKLQSKANLGELILFKSSNSYTLGTINDSFKNLLYDNDYSDYEIEQWIKYIVTHDLENETLYDNSKELKKANKIFKEYLKLTFETKYITNREIVFEIVKSAEGTLYAREIQTKKLFPIKNNNLVMQKLRFLKGNIEYLPGIEASEMHKIESIITVYDKASDLNVKDYMSNSVKNEVNYYSSLNSFKKEVSIVEENEELNEEMNIASRILNLLSILFTIDRKTYEEYKQIYDSIFVNKEDSINIEMSLKERLIELENSIMFEIVFKKHDNKYEYLISEENKMIENIKNNSEFDTVNNKTLNDMYEIYLKNQNRFSPEEQNTILNCFARLYFYSMMKNNNQEFNNNDIKTRVILFSKYLYDNNETNKYIEDENNIVEEISKIEFQSQPNETRKEKSILLKLFKK